MDPAKVRIVVSSPPSPLYSPTSMDYHTKPGSIPSLDFEVPQPPVSSVAPPPARRWSDIGQPPSSRALRITGNVLRGVASLLTFIAAIVMGTAAQTKRVVVVDDNGSPETLSGTAKSHYSSALVYFIVINVLALVYSATTLAVSAMNAGRSNLDLPLSISDLLATVFLVSCNSAASAISVVAEHGNRHFGWDKICQFVSKYCAQVTAAVVLSMFATAGYVVLLLLTLMRLHKRL